MSPRAGAKRVLRPRQHIPVLAGRFITRTPARASSVAAPEARRRRRIMCWRGRVHEACAEKERETEDARKTAYAGNARAYARRAADGGR